MAAIRVSSAVRSSRRNHPAPLDRASVPEFEQRGPDDIIDTWSGEPDRTRRGAGVCFGDQEQAGGRNHMGLRRRFKVSADAFRWGLPLAVLLACLGAGESQAAGDLIK